MKQIVKIRSIDIFRLHCHIWLRSKMAIFSTFMLTIAQMSNLREELTFGSSLIFLMLVWSLYLFLFVILVFLFSVLNPKWRKGRFGEHIIEVSDEGITESTELNKTFISWQAIEDIRLLDGWILIRWGAEAFPFPSHSFSSETSWREFGDNIINLWNRHKNDA